MALTLLLSGIFIVNLPFGYWRESVRKFSTAWFIAVHAAVPLVIAMRIGLGIDWSLMILPLMLAAYFLGQAAGARLRRNHGGSGSSGPVS